MLAVTVQQIADFLGARWVQDPVMLAHVIN